MAAPLLRSRAGVSPAAARPASAAVKAAEEKRVVNISIPQKLGFLFELKRYKVAYGGRGAAKSHSFARALLALGAAQKLRILCTREIQNSIKDSVHKLLKDQIEAMSLGNFYQVLDTEIRGANGTEFLFSGLHGHTIDSIKSYEGIDIVWVEEAQSVTRASWTVLIPTIRAENSEIWVSFNPDMESDETYKRFVLTKRDDAIVVLMNYYDNFWFPKVLEKERLHDKKTLTREEYRNIWLGDPRTAVKGAIYAREVRQMKIDGRYRSVPYDPRFPVHTFWDLGWNDKMTVICVQKPHPSFLSIVNYYEDNFKRYDEVVETLGAFGYRWGTHYLPHDGANKNPQTGASAEMALKKLFGLRSRVKIIPRHDPEEAIRTARTVWPRVYLNDNEEESATGYIGGRRLMEVLGRYKRDINKRTDEAGSPTHDEWSHGADAFRGMCLYADKLRNPSDELPMPHVDGHRSTVTGTGPLG